MDPQLEDAVRQELQALLPVDTREGLASAAKQVHQNRDRFVLSSRQSMAKGAAVYADFARCIEHSQAEAEVAGIREAAEQLQKHADGLGALSSTFARSRFSSDAALDRVVGETEAQALANDTWTDCRVTLLEHCVFVDNVQVPLDGVHVGTEADTFTIDRPDGEPCTIRMGPDEVRARLVEMLHSSGNVKQAGLLPADSLDNAKLTGWLDDLHEAIAMGNFEAALEAVDRIRYELAGKGGPELHPAHAKRLDKYVGVLEERLLQSLRRQSMDAGTAARLVHLLNGLGRGVEARDCLLSAYSDRITALKLQCCAGSGHAAVPMDLQCSIIINALASAVAVVRRAFPDPVMSSGLLVWLQAHVLGLSKDVRRHRDHVEVLHSARRALAPLKDCGFDLEFLL